MSGPDEDKPYDNVVTTTAATSVEGINDFSIGCVMD